MSFGSGCSSNVRQPIVRCWCEAARAFLSEISARTGLHEGSIRRILYDLARRMAVVRRTANRQAVPIRPET